MKILCKKIEHFVNISYNYEQRENINIIQGKI